MAYQGSNSMPRDRRRLGWGATLAIVVAFLMVLDSGAVFGGTATSRFSVSSHAVSTTDGAALLREARASIAAGAGPSMHPSVPLSPLSPGGNGSSPGAWLKVEASNSSTPPVRYLGMMAYDPVDHYVVLFGGSSSTTYAMDDTWAFANGSWSELFPSTSPGPRYLGVMTWDARDGYLVLFGGYDCCTTTYFYNDTWTFLHGQWSNITSSSTKMPSQRWRPNMAYDSADGYVVLFGGTPSTGNPLSDTWKFAGGVWTNITGNVSGNPPGRYRSTMTYDAADNYVLLFGGCTSSTCPPATSDTWTYRNYTWSHLTPSTHPSARVYTAMDYDAAKGYVVLFGGSSNVASPSNMMSDTWSFLNGTWTNLTSKITNPPSGRGFQMMAFDPLDNYSVLFGGWNANTNTYLGDTWSYGPSIFATLRPMLTTIDLGQTVTFNVSALSNTTLLNYSYQGLPSGCTSANASLLNCTPGVTGTFPVQINVTTPFKTAAYLNVTLQVHPDPSITSFTATPSATTQGGTVVVSTLITAGTAPYHYTYLTLPPGCSSRDVWNLTCRPSTAGSYTIGVEAFDAAEFPVFSNTSLLVNIRPAVTSFSAFPTILDVGQETNFTVAAHGGTGTLSYNYTGLPNGCLSQDTARLACRPSSSGLFSPIVQVTDSVGFFATALLNISVGIGPSISEFAVSTSTIDAGQSVTFWLNATGGTGQLNYSYSSNLPGCPLSRVAQNTCSPTGTGTYTVTGTATDGVGMSVSASVTITVNPIPSITSVTGSPAVLDVRQNLTLTVVVAGGTMPFTYAYTGLPTGCASADTANLTCVPTASGTPSITVVVTDHLGRSAQGSAFVTINPAPTVRLVSANPTTVAPGSTTTISVTAVGGSGVYSYLFTGLPAGCSSANTSSLRCTPSATGTFNVSVRVTDSLGASATGYGNLTVQSSSPGGGSFLGGSSTLTYALVGVVVAAVVVGAAVLLMRRRRSAPPPSGEPSNEESPAETVE